MGLSPFDNESKMYQNERKIAAIEFKCSIKDNWMNLNC